MHLSKEIKSCMQKKNPYWERGSYSFTEVILELVWNIKVHFVFMWYTKCPLFYATTFQSTSLYLVSITSLMIFCPIYAYIICYYDQAKKLLHNILSCAVLWWWIVVPMLNPMLEYSPMSAVCDCLFDTHKYSSFVEAASSICYLRTCHIMVIGTT